MISKGILVLYNVTHCTRSAALYRSCFLFNLRTRRPQILVKGSCFFLQILKGAGRTITLREGTTTSRTRTRQELTSSRGTSSRIVRREVEMLGISGVLSKGG